jgi:hypothetical protein
VLFLEWSTFKLLEDFQTFFEGMNIKFLIDINGEAEIFDGNSRRTRMLGYFFKTRSIEIKLREKLSLPIAKSVWSNAILRTPSLNGKAAFLLL